MRPADVRKLIPSVYCNKIVRTFNSNQPIISKIARSANTRKPVCPLNSSKPILAIDFRKSVRPLNSNKPVYPVDVCKSGGPVDVRKPDCFVDTRKLFFVDIRKLLEAYYFVFDFTVFCSFHKY